MSRQSIDDDADHLDAHPERIELMPAALAQAIVLVSAFLIVEADLELFPVAVQLDLQRLARQRDIG